MPHCAPTIPAAAIRADPLARLAPPTRRMNVSGTTFATANRIIAQPITTSTGVLLSALNPVAHWVANCVPREAMNWKIISFAPTATAYLIVARAEPDRTDSREFFPDAVAI